MARTPSGTSPRQAALLAKLLAGASSTVAPAAPEVFSSGCPPLDRVLPGGGLPRGALVEWRGPAPGGGASLLALAAAREAHRAAGGAIVVVDRTLGFYGPAAAAWGLDLDHTILVRPRTERDEHWAVDQALRCPHAAAVLAWPQRLEGRTFRRWQLAVELSRAVGLLVRPSRAARGPSWAHVQLAIAPRAAPPRDDGSAAWRLAIQLVRVRGAALGYAAPPHAVELLVEIDPCSGAIHETRPGDLAAELARAAARAEQA